MLKRNVTGWVIILVAVAVALFISARAAIFDGQPLAETGFYWMLIISVVLVGGYFILTSTKKK